MDKVTFFTDEQGFEHAIIDHGNEQFTSMPLAEYERRQAQQVEHLTEIITPTTD
jgi:hypothetical protein